MTTPKLHLVSYAGREDYITAMKDYDNSFTNYAFGSVLEVDCMDSERGKTLVGIYRGDQLV